MHSFSEHWKNQLDERKQNDLYRSRISMQSAQSTRVRVDGRELINFSSNDYLSLANHPQLVEAMTVAAKKYGVGSGASHLICGHSEEHHALEEELAAFTGRDKAVLFSTGYMANLGVLSALLDKDAIVFQDKLNHASLIDGALLSAAQFKRFKHNDMQHLAQRLENSTVRKKMIAVDGVFSMDGDVAKLPEICTLAKQYQACVMVDDAHGFGCLGEQGAGTPEMFGLSQQDIPIYMGTLGKGLGSFGAFVAGDANMIDNIIQFARSYIYTTAMPPAIAASTRAGLKLLTTEAWRREKLKENIEYFAARAKENKLPINYSNTAIQALIIGDSDAALSLSQTLLNHGFLVTAIRPPTVPVGSARLRIALNAEHSASDIDQLTEVISKFMPVSNSQGL